MSVVRYEGAQSPSMILNVQRFAFQQQSEVLPRRSLKAIQSGPWRGKALALTKVAVIPAQAPARRRPLTPMDPSSLLNRPLKASYAYSWVALYGITFRICTFTPSTWSGFGSHGCFTAANSLLPLLKSHRHMPNRVWLLHVLVILQHRFWGFSSFTMTKQFSLTSPIQSLILLLANLWSHSLQDFTHYLGNSLLPFLGNH